MGCQKRLHSRRIGLSARWIGAGGEQLLVKAARRVHCEDRDVVHACAPFLAAGRQESQRHAAHRHRRIRLKGHAASEREAANQRDAAGPENSGFRQCRCLTAAFEPAGDANSLGVVAAVKTIRLMAQSYAGKRPISKWMGGLYEGLWCKTVIGSRERCASSFPAPLVRCTSLELAPLRNADRLSFGEDGK